MNIAMHIDRRTACLRAEEGRVHAAMSLIPVSLLLFVLLLGKGGVPG